MSTPYVGFSNDTLKKQPKVEKGQLIKCPNCSGSHELKCGTSNGKESDTLMFYECGGQDYLAAVDGRLVIGVKSDVSGAL